MSPDGSFVYLTNRGHNSIAIFAVESAGATLAPDRDTVLRRRLAAARARSTRPASCCSSPTSDSNNITTFHVDTTDRRADAGRHLHRPDSGLCPAWLMFVSE